MESKDTTAKDTQAQKSVSIRVAATRPIRPVILSPDKSWLRSDRNPKIPSRNLQARTAPSNSPHYRTFLLPCFCLLSRPRAEKNLGNFWGSFFSSSISLRSFDDLENKIQHGTCVDDFDIVPPGCSQKVIILHHCLPASARCLLLPTLYPAYSTAYPRYLGNWPLSARPGFFRAVQKLLKSHSRTHRNRAKLRNPSISSVDSVIPGTGLYHSPRLEHAILLCQRFAPLKRQSINNCNTFSHDIASRERESSIVVL